MIKGATKHLVAILDISHHICMSPGTGQTMASPPPAELSPGPLRMSDLDPSTPTTPLTTRDLQRPPRKLDPISSAEKKKRPRKRQTKREAPEEDGKKEGDSLREGQQMFSQQEQKRSTQSDHSLSSFCSVYRLRFDVLIAVMYLRFQGTLYICLYTYIHMHIHIHTGAEPMRELERSKLRAILDPIYNSPPVQSKENSNNEPTEQTGNERDRDAERGIVIPQEISEMGDPHHSRKLSKRKRTRRGRKREEERKESEEPLPAPVEEGEPQEDVDHGELDEPHPPPSEPPPQGTNVTLHSMVTISQPLTSSIHPFICPHMP